MGQADREGDLTTGRHSCQEVCQDLLLDVFPRLPMNDAPDGLAGEAPVTSPEFRHGGAGCIRLPDGTNVVFGEVGFVMVFSLGAARWDDGGSGSLPSLRYHVGRVHRGGTREEVGKPSTCWNIATVAHEVRRERAMYQGPRHPMREFRDEPTVSEFNFDHPVAVAILGPNPHPARRIHSLDRSRSLLKSLPESFVEFRGDH